jgi:hypothetical protein
MEQNALEKLAEMLETLKPYMPKPIEFIEPKQGRWKLYREGESEYRRKL